MTSVIFFSKQLYLTDVTHVFISLTVICTLEFLTQGLCNIDQAIEQQFFYEICYAVQGAPKVKFVK